MRTKSLLSVQLTFLYEQVINTSLNHELLAISYKYLYIC